MEVAVKWNWQSNGGGVQIERDALFFNPSLIVAVNWKWRSNRGDAQLEVLR